MRGAVLLLLHLVPVAGLLGSWTLPRARPSQPVSRTYTGTTCLEKTHATADVEPSEALVSDLLELFQGEFDNYDQVVEDRVAGLTPGPGGGHEHIHCSLQVLDPSQVPEQVVVAPGEERSAGVGPGGKGKKGVERPLAVVAAKYYFNGDSNVVFRYRLYSFHACPTETRTPRGDAVMLLWRLLPHVETRLRAAGYDLDSFDWGAWQRQPQQQHQEHDHHEASKGEAKPDNRRESADGCNDNVAEHMLGCEIFWSRSDGSHVPSGSGTSSAASRRSSSSSSSSSRLGAVPKGAEGDQGWRNGDSAAAFVRSSGTSEAQARAEAADAEAEAPAPKGPYFVGLMGKDDSGTWIESQNISGLEILVKDDLRIWPDQLWVNDRGFDREGNFVYGNQRGVPYKMRRVVAGGPLEWTLGERYRTPEMYADKMSAIGVTLGQRVGSPVAQETAS